MLLGILLMLFAKFIEMPTWLKIVTIVIGALQLVYEVVKIGFKIESLKETD